MRDGGEPAKEEYDPFGPCHEENVLSQPLSEIQVDAATIQRLLEAECPELAGHPIRLVDEGWDNFTFLIGQQHAARLPRRAVAVPYLVNEQRWLPILAPKLSIEVPTPIHIGKPGKVFHWPWSVVKWIEGNTAETHLFTDSDTALLAKNLVALHQEACTDAPVNLQRGVPLETKNEIAQDRLDRLGRLPGVDAPRLAAIWREACTAPRAAQRVWLHGDLHPRNVVIRN